MGNSKKLCFLYKFSPNQIQTLNAANMNAIINVISKVAKKSTNTHLQKRYSRIFFLDKKWNFSIFWKSVYKCKIFETLHHHNVAVFGFTRS